MNEYILIILVPVLFVAIALRAAAEPEYTVPQLAVSEGSITLTCHPRFAGLAVRVFFRQEKDAPLQAGQIGILRQSTTWKGEVAAAMKKGAVYFIIGSPAAVASMEANDIGNKAPPGLQIVMTFYSPKEDSPWYIPFIFHWGVPGAAPFSDKPFYLNKQQAPAGLSP